MKKYVCSRNVFVHTIFINAKDEKPITFIKVLAERGLTYYMALIKIMKIQHILYYTILYCTILHISLGTIR